MKNLIVKLRIYKGQEAYDANGKIISENQTMKLKYNVLEWKNFLKTAKHMGYSKVEVVECLDGNKKIKIGDGITHPIIKTPIEVLNDIKSCLAVAAEKQTPEQVRIAELEKTINAMQASLAPVSTIEIPTTLGVVTNGAVKISNSNGNGVDIEKLKIKYAERTKELGLGKDKEGLTPHHKWKQETLLEKIAELENN